MTAYASVHLDGKLDCNTVRVGIMDRNTPIVTFKVRAGLQDHPVRAIERLAVVIWAYCNTAKAAGEPYLEVNISGSLASRGDCSFVVARSVQWHTSSQVRTAAEKTIAQIKKQPANWPQEDLLRSA